MALPVPLQVRQASATAAGGGTTAAMLVRFWPFTVTLIVATSGKVQYTTSPYLDIVDGSAVWVDWNLGTVTEDTSSGSPGPVTGVRGVSVVGAITLELAQLEPL